MLIYLCSNITYSMYLVYIRASFVPSPPPQLLSLAVCIIFVLHTTIAVVEVWERGYVRVSSTYTTKQQGHKKYDKK